MGIIGDPPGSLAAAAVGLTPSAIPATVNPDLAETRFLTDLLHQPVLVELLSGKVLRGQLTGYSRYCVVLRWPRGTEQLIFKHAVARVQRDREPEPGT